MRVSSTLFNGRLRTRLTTKMSGKTTGYYKGTGTGSTGQHTKYGGYLIQWQKVRTYVVPTELSLCKLTPFVSRQVRLEDVKLMNRGLYKDGNMQGSDYLKLWKVENGTD